eukprot:TRINITY_DN10617_c0_g1_i1.p1 TRINITY_DN10617_c0_g1~~TRINITY_DN10617_c0_g1_i1.p1  ORF type:complete len:325 (+),score=82.67 TRINITY_DN10617_c0_g1_i1:81-1055(+)
MSRYLITSAAGRVGKEVVARIRQAQPSAHIRCGCRRANKNDFLKSLGADEVVEFDYTKPETFEAALKDVNALYSSSPDPALAGHENFCKFIKEKYTGQIKHAVRLSCMGAEQNTGSYDLDQHVSRQGAKVPHMLQGYWFAEKYLIDTGIPTTAVRGNFFMSHLFKPDVENIKNEGWFKLPFGGARNSYVSTNDLGEICAMALLGGAETYGNKFYDITGPKPQSMHEVAADLSKAYGKEVKYVESDPEQFKADFGMTRWEFIEYLLNGFYTRVSPDFYNLTGRAPTSYFDHLTKPGVAGETGIDELFNAPSMWTKGVDLFKDQKH